MESKSRKLTTYQYYQILQLEWLVADLRVRIYPAKKDKDFWNRVKEGKERRFVAIAEKNQLPTILIDDEMRRIFESSIYKLEGPPAFIYKDDLHRQMQEPLDLAYYYSKGTEVRFDNCGEIAVGKVKSYTPGQSIMIIEFNGKEEQLLVEKATRIL
jgi:hypothetical protein